MEEYLRTKGEGDFLMWMKLPALMRPLGTGNYYRRLIVIGGPYKFRSFGRL